MATLELLPHWTSVYTREVTTERGAYTLETLQDQLHLFSRIKQFAKLLFKTFFTLGLALFSPSIRSEYREIFASKAELEIEKDFLSQLQAQLTKYINEDIDVFAEKKMVEGNIIEHRFELRSGEVVCQIDRKREVLTLKQGELTFSPHEYPSLKLFYQLFFPKKKEIKEKILAQLNSRSPSVTMNENGKGYSIATPDGRRWMVSSKTGAGEGLSVLIMQINQNCDSVCEAFFDECPNYIETVLK